ncbi:MAG: 50S ribosomal protein L3 [Spirochaetaceae bacterium]|jgi:large subunit ribosomal protein L3|nr:50S ribosomal protein L3 [Spirochaetaceae bacterium]
MLALMAKKIGMTQIFDESGNLVPVSVIKIVPNTVIAQKSVEKDGYNAVLFGIEDKREALVNKPEKGIYPENITPKRELHEIRDFEKECAVGDTIGIEAFEGVRYIDVTGVSKGKGFQGVVKRYHFGGGRRTHGSKFHREPGSTGQSTYPHKTFKNVKLPGRMGREKTTVLNLRVIEIDTEKQLLLVKGAVPGVHGRTVIVRNAVKKG